MFIIKSKADNTINWPVSVEIAADGGKIQKYEFTGTFKLLSDDEAEAAPSAELAAPTSDTPAAAQNAWKVEHVTQILKTMTGWKGVVDEDKQPIEFTPENLMAAARSPHGISIVRALNLAVTEVRQGARAKN